jgi:hypothetical protein
MNSGKLALQGFRFDMWQVCAYNGNDPRHPRLRSLQAETMRCDISDTESLQRNSFPFLEIHRD